MQYLNILSLDYLNQVKAFYHSYKISRNTVGVVGTMLTTTLLLWLYVRYNGGSFKAIQVYQDYGQGSYITNYSRLRLLTEHDLLYIKDKQFHFTDRAILYITEICNNLQSFESRNVSK